MPLTAIVAWAPMTRAGMCRWQRRARTIGPAIDKRRGQQHRGGASESSDAHGFATRWSTQRQQQCDEARDADEPVKCAEHRTRRGALGPKMQCREDAAQQGSGQ